MLRARLSSPGRGPRLSSMWAGFTYDDQKRVNDLLVAVSRLRGDWKLKLIGGPTKGSEIDEARLKSLGAELGLDGRVEWLGWQNDPWRAAGETTALVMTSAYEGFGMVLVEANARGIVCVSSDCESGPSEIVVPGSNGWLFPVGDIDRLTARLQSLVDAPEDLPPQEVVRTTALRYSAPVIAQRAREALQQAMDGLRC